MGFLKPPKIDVPATTPAMTPPPFISQPKPSQKKSTVPTFLGTEKTPTGDSLGAGGMERGKTLLGQ